MSNFGDRIIAAGDKTAAELEKDFLKSVKVTIRETDWDRLERDLNAYVDGDEVIDGIAWEEFDPTDRLQDLFEVSLEIHGEHIGSITGGAKFDYVDPNALKWIEEYGAQEIKYITETERAAIKDIILTGYKEGITSTKQVQQIRANIGLDERRSQTLQTYGENLFAKGKSDEEVWRLMERKGKVLLNARARTIAINETSEAASQATYQSTKSAVKRGVLDSDAWEEYRIVADDERLCDICRAAASESRKLPDGVYHSTGLKIAKIHTKCRCVGGLREIGMKKKEIREGVRATADIIFEAKGRKETDTSIFCPTVPFIEGVFSGRGFPVLRLYDEFSQDARWLNGLTVVTNHEPLDPNARRIGQFHIPHKKDAEIGDISEALDAQNKRLRTITEFLKIDITQRESEKIRSKDPFHGSMQFSCNLEMTSGNYEGIHYEAIERRPYVFYEYSAVANGIVTPEDGAGFNIECDGCRELSKAASKVNEPVMDCTKDGKPGKKFGKSGFCYTYDPKDSASKAAAMKKAAKQGAAQHANAGESKICNICGRLRETKNYHSVRVRNPGDFEKGSFKTVELPKSKGGKGGVLMIAGHLKGETTMTAQAYHFPADKYTLTEVKSWLKKNGIKKYISITPAGKESKSNSKSKSSAHGAVKRGISMEGDLDSGHESETELGEQELDSSALLKRMEVLEGGFKAVQEENKSLKDTLEKDRKSRVFEAFQAKLKPAHLAEAEKLFKEYEKDPATWAVDNIAKFVHPKETKLGGSAIVDGGDAGDGGYADHAAKHQTEAKAVWTGSD